MPTTIALVIATLAAAIAGCAIVGNVLRRALDDPSDYDTDGDRAVDYCGIVQIDERFFERPSFVDTTITDLPIRRPFDKPVDSGGAAAPEFPDAGRGGNLVHNLHDRSE